MRGKSPKPNMSDRAPGKSAKNRKMSSQNTSVVWLASFLKCKLCFCWCLQSKLACSFLTKRSLADPQSGHDTEAAAKGKEHGVLHTTQVRGQRGPSQVRAWHNKAHDQGGKPPDPDWSDWHRTVTPRLAEQVADD